MLISGLYLRIVMAMGAAVVGSSQLATAASNNQQNNNQQEQKERRHRKLVDNIAKVTMMEPTMRIASSNNFAVSQPIRNIIPEYPPVDDTRPEDNEEEDEIPIDNGYIPDGALQQDYPMNINQFVGNIKSFEGISGAQVLQVVGKRGVPPDPMGDVGKTQYVEMVNNALCVYNKETGIPETQVLAFSDFWLDLPHCSTNQGDPIVIYDQFNDRWILMRFKAVEAPYYLCFAISTTDDAAGNYYLYSLDFGNTFPDYPKMGIWRDSLIVTTRNFLDAEGFAGIGVMAFELQQLYNGNPTYQFLYFLANPQDLALVGNGMLPADVDGNNIPEKDAAIVILGTQDDERYGTMDGVNIWELRIDWANPMNSTFEFAETIEVLPVDTIFPCGEGRDCVPQPDTDQGLDVLSYRQRPLHRLAYRRFVENRLGVETTLSESFVTNQAVEAREGIAGVRWYEVERNPQGEYRMRQQGTYAPDDGSHRWMGSVAQDKKGNMALGYSISSETIYPSIRFTGRKRADPPGQMTIAEGTIMDGTGSQLSDFNRWGDYTSMNIDPVDDCTFYYINQYYAETSDANWLTRFGSFRIEGCIDDDADEPSINGDDESQQQRHQRRREWWTWIMGREQ